MVMYILDAKFKESKPTHASLIESIGSIIGFINEGEIFMRQKQTSSSYAYKNTTKLRGVLYIYNKNLMKDQFFSAKLLLD